MGLGIWCFLWCRGLGGCDGKEDGQGRWRCLPWGRWVLGEAGGVQPGNPCGLPRLYGHTPYEKKENEGSGNERAPSPNLRFPSFRTAYWGDTFVYPIRLSSTSLAASLPSLMAHTTSD